MLTKSFAIRWEQSAADYLDILVESDSRHVDVQDAIERVLGRAYGELDTPLPFQVDGFTVHVLRTPVFFPGVPELYVSFTVNDTDEMIAILDMRACKDALDS